MECRRLDRKTGRVCILGGEPVGSAHPWSWPQCVRHLSQFPDVAARKRRRHVRLNVATVLAVSSLVLAASRILISCTTEVGVFLLNDASAGVSHRHVPAPMTLRGLRPTADCRHRRLRTRLGVGDGKDGGANIDIPVNSAQAKGSPDAKASVAAREQSHSAARAGNAQSDGAGDDSSFQWFVPGFVLLWAVGYGAIYGTEMFGGGMGDKGGIIGVAFGALLFLLVLVAILQEVLK